MVKLLTVDVWDTLLRRRVHPDLVKLQLALAMLQRYRAEVLDRYQCSWKLLQLRQSIEGELVQQSLRQGGDGEYTSAEVIGHVLKRATHPESPLQLPSSSLLQDLVAWEFSIELDLTYPDSCIRDLLAGQSYGRILFLSDFYWPADQIQKLLSYHGFDDIIQSGVSSCDVGLNKRSGRLYRHVQERFAVDPESHLHIGDNYQVDVVMARQQGMQALHYQPEAQHQQRCWNERVFHNRAQLFEHLHDQLPPSEHAAHALGQRCAPLFIGFGLFVAEQALTNRLDQLFFFTREGEFFLKVFEALFPSGIYAQQRLPQGQLLEVSRLATFAASLQTVTTDSLMRLWNLYSSQSLRALLLSLAFSSEQIRAMAERFDLDLERVIQYPWQDPTVIDLLAQPLFLQHVHDHCHKRREQLAHYLKSRGVGKELRLGIVDIGWRGTIQDNLAHCLPSHHLHGLYLGLARFLNQQPLNTSKQAFGPDLNLSQDHAVLLDAVSALEMVCNSPHGSVEGYHFDADSQPQAVRRIDSEENLVYDAFTRPFQEGVLSACTVWSGFVQDHAITASELRPTALAIWHNLLRSTPQELADAYVQLNHNEVFGVGGFVDKSAVPSVRTVLLAPFHRRRRMELIAFVRLTQWPSVVLRRRDLSAYHRSLLVVCLFAGRCAKRALQRYSRLTPQRYPHE
jgi:histidinol phosphatase-like enzyme